MSCTILWQTVTRVNTALADGLKVGEEHYASLWEEQSGKSGNRGILFAFYKLMEQH